MATGVGVLAKYPAKKIEIRICSAKLNLEIFCSLLIATSLSVCDADSETYFDLN